jgi:3-hydroxy-9,10-secoandrosta-1,3,5(10)-triene-9,17-dione monooxygenase reductase component
VEKEDGRRKAEGGRKEARQAFPAFAGQLVTGVSVVVTMVDGEPLATTASSVVAASWHPPLLAVLFGNASRMSAALERSRRFTVNVLGEADHCLAQRFARHHRSHGWAALSGIHLQRLDPAPPIFQSAIAWADCTVVQIVPMGDHRCFVAEVGALERDPARKPLAYYRGRFRGLGPLIAPAAWTEADIGDLAATW